MSLQGRHYTMVRKLAPFIAVLAMQIAMPARAAPAPPQEQRFAQAFGQPQNIERSVCAATLRLQSSPLATAAGPI